MQGEGAKGHKNNIGSAREQAIAKSAPAL